MADKERGFPMTIPSGYTEPSEQHVTETIRTTFRPDVDLEVEPYEANDLRVQGLVIDPEPPPVEPLTEGTNTRGRDNE
jgi:hypothetical protein